MFQDPYNHRAGLLESVYEVLLQRELQNRGLQVVRQSAVPIIWEGIEFEEGFAPI